MQQGVGQVNVEAVLARAGAAAQRGNFFLAEGLCRDTLELGQTDWRLHHMLARVALSMGAFWAAAESLGRARAGERERGGGVLQGEDTQRTLEDLESRQAAQDAAILAAGPRWMVIRAWGCGFGADLDHVLGCLLLAEVTGRTPIVHWGAASKFRDAGVENAWESFFEPATEATLGDVIGKKHAYYPPKWNDGNLRAPEVNRSQGPHSRMQYLTYLARPEPVVVMDFMCGVVNVLPWVREGHRLRGASVSGAMRDLVKRYVRPRAEIAADVEAFARANFRGEVAAVHVRGSDKVIEDPALDEGNAALRRGVEQLAAERTELSLFLLTDSEPIRQEYERIFGSRLTVAPATRATGKTGVHFLPLKDRARLGREVLRDMLLAARCDWLLGPGNSNVSCMAAHFRDWEPGRLRFQVRSMHEQRNYFAYTW